MKSSINTILLAFSFYSVVISQINDITRLPVQNPSQSNIESTPVWISENEIMIFYVLRHSELSSLTDTIFSTLSTNRGISWKVPEIVQVVERITNNQIMLYLNSLRTNSGRILLAWSVQNEGIKVIYSDDDGQSWSQPITVLGGGIPAAQKNSRYLILNQLADNRISLSFSSSTSNKSYYRYSYNNGETWMTGDPINFSTIIGTDAIELSLISIGQDSLLAIYQITNYGIFSRYSFDDGLYWTQATSVTGSYIDEIKPRVTVLDEGTIKLVYLYRLQTGVGEQNDIFYKVTTDNGYTWTDEERFTNYVGEDDYINIGSYEDKRFLIFSTERFGGSYQDNINYQIAYAILDETVEQFTPPKVFWAEVLYDSINYDKKEFIYQAKIIDDEAVDKVYVTFENSSYTGEMFDDGMHSDGEANDTLYGNVFPFGSLHYFGDYMLDVNKIKMPMNGQGVLADVNILSGSNITILPSDADGNSCPSEQEETIILYGSGGRFEEGSFMFSAGFFMSGYSGGYLWSNGVASASLVEDYLQGKVNGNPEDPLNKFYVVNKEDPPFGYSWKNWKDAVSLGAEFYDGDGNGVYDPVDRNWNGTWDVNEDMPMLIGDATAWCVYNDGKPSNQRRWEVEPQGIEVRQTVFASSIPELENIMFIRYSILNTGTVNEVMDSVYFGFWADTDLGNYSQNITGCDVELNSGFVYNNDSDAIYGINSPASFISLLQGPVEETGNIEDTASIHFGELIGTQNFPGYNNLNMTAHVIYLGGDPNLNDPSNKEEARNYLKGLNRVGELVDPCIFPYGEVLGGAGCDTINPYFWLSGDPVTQYGWLGTTKTDVRSLIGIGPFLLEKDKPQEIIGTYVVGRGNDPINSITVSREIVERGVQEYKSNFASMTYSAPPPTKPVNSYILYQNYPNPFNSTTTIRYELPEDGIVTIKLYDILGQEVKTILNEFKKADRYEVKFDAGGLSSGVYIYRIKVNEFITSKKMLLIR